MRPYLRTMPSQVQEGQSFSTTVGLLYVFNLIVGTGALALPKAFQTAGYVLGTLLLLVSAFMSYICATFIIETMSVSNAILKRNRENEVNQLYGLESSNDEAEGSAEENYVQQKRSFDITQKVELSEMAYLVLGKIGVIMTYLFLTLYLFGDLAIYSTTVPKSLMNVLCESPNVTIITNDLPCYQNHFDDFSRLSVYRICVALFACFCFPMVIAGMTKTKYIQLATTVSRWTAFTLMIVLASMQLFREGPQASPPAADIKGFGSLFGVSIYAFMCHHSIPGLLTPIRNKKNFNYKLIGVYGVIFIFYCTLSVTGLFAFSVVQDVYTLNFLHDDKTSLVYSLIDYFLALFPVFTLTSSYIIVAITLSNNLKILLTMLQNSNNTESNDLESEALLESSSDREDMIDLRSPVPTSTSSPTNNRSAFFDQISPFIFPFIAIFLPTILSFFNDNVLVLASITGSYPGVGVQFIIPSCLVIGARKYANSQLHHPVPETIRSPFKQNFWPYLTLLWAAFTIVNVTIHLLHFG
jgi:amino acid permease